MRPARTAIPFHVDIFVPDDQAEVCVAAAIAAAATRGPCRKRVN